MAAGALRGTLTANAASITNPFSATGSVLVSIGDLVFAVLAQQTALTVTAAADNLGNTYAAVNAGTDPGISTSRAFYSRVTVAGTLTSVDFTTTASANNVAAAAAVIAGPVLVSPIDANPANNNNTDNTTPFNCPATGTLAQALEIVCSWMSWTGNSATFSATSPNLKALQANSSTLIAAIIGYQAVNSTGTVTPVFTGTNPTDSVQGTASFKIDTSEPASTTREISTALPIPAPAQPAQSWTVSLNLPLLGIITPPIDTTHQTRSPLYAYRQTVTWYNDWSQNFVIRQVVTVTLPPGEFVTDRPLGQRARLQPYNLGTWTWQYNLNLIGKDALPSGEISTALPTRGYEYPVLLRTWIAQAPQPIFKPVSVTTWGRPDDQPPLLQTWVWKYNLNLIGKDKLPVGEAIFALPVPRDYPVQLRQWFSKAPPAVVVVGVPFSQQDWANPRGYEYSVSLRGWTQPPTQAVSADTTNIPARILDWGTPPEAGRLQPEWIFQRNLALTTAPAKPFAQYDWPVSYGPRQPERTVTVSYNLNLIGKDKLPTGEVTTALSPQPTLSAIQLRTWINSVNLALITGVVVKPFAQYDWPLNIGPRQPAQTFTGSYNQNLIGKDKLPAGEIVTDLPPQPAQVANALRTWLNINTPDALAAAFMPAKVLDWGTPPSSPQALQIWISSVNLALTSVTVKLPFNQYDWPINTGPRQPVQVFTASFNQNLIGKDKLPTGEIVTDLPPRDHLRAIDLRTWVQTVNLALTTQAAKLPFNQYDWPINTGPRQPTQVFTAFYNPNLVGKDRLPFRQQDWPLPTPRFRPLDLVSWIDRAKFYLQRPGRQTDWPLPRPLTQPDRSFIFVFPKVLIGKDRLPFRQQDWPLPREPRQPDAHGAREFASGLNLALKFPAAQRPHNQYDWPLPQQPFPPWQRYGYEFQGGNLYPIQVNPIPPPPPPTPPTDERIAYNAGNEWQMLDRIKEPGPVGWR